MKTPITRRVFIIASLATGSALFLLPQNSKTVSSHSSFLKDDLLFLQRGVKELMQKEPKFLTMSFQEQSEVIDDFSEIKIGRNWLSMVFLTYDICVVGTGAGASGVAYILAKAGKKVVMLERVDFYHRQDFSKDEVAFTKRDIVTPNLKDSYHTIEDLENGKWLKTLTYVSESTFFNGNIVGGSSNFMSGYFHRLKPNDFKLKSVYGEIEGANIIDWVIDYNELEPYYEKVERLVGVSGEVTKYKHQEPRSTKDFPYPPLDEHPISKLIDKSFTKLGFTPYKTPRAILSKAKDKRESCYSIQTIVEVMVVVVEQKGVLERLY